MCFNAPHLIWGSISITTSGNGINWYEYLVPYFLYFHEIFKSFSLQPLKQVLRYLYLVNSTLPSLSASAKISLYRICYVSSIWWNPLPDIVICESYVFEWFRRSLMRINVKNLPKLFCTTARTDLADCVHGAGLVHSQKRSLANQLCVHLLLRVPSSRWLCARSAQDFSDSDYIKLRYSKKIDKEHTPYRSFSLCYQIRIINLIIIYSRSLLDFKILWAWDG